MNRFAEVHRLVDSKRPKPKPTIKLKPSPCVHCPKMENCSEKMCTTWLRWYRKAWRDTVKLWRDLCR